MGFGRAYITAVCGRNKDRATWVSPLTNEKPLVVVKACVDVMWEVVREDRGNSRRGVVGKGEAPLRRGGYRSILKGVFGAENGDVGRGRGSGSHRGPEVFASRGGDKDVVRVNGDVLVERGEKESVKYFLGYAGGCGRHGW